MARRDVREHDATLPVQAEDVSEINARLKAWRERGDPQALWPHVHPEDRLRAHRDIAAATRAVLDANAARARPVLGAADDRYATALGVAAFVSGMGPLLGYWAAQGRIDADARISAVLACHLQHALPRAQLFALQLARVLDACAARGTAPIVMKGAHTAYEYFPDPAVRCAADIDLLVEPAQLGAVHAALADADFFEARRTTYPERSEWLLRGAPTQVHSLEYEHAENPWSLDLHTKLEREYFRGLSAGFGNAAFEITTTRSLAGRSARVLAQPLLAAYLALNASYGIDELRLIRILELVLVIRQDTGSGALDWAALTELVQRTRTARFIFPALELAERLAPGTLPANVRGMLTRAATPRMGRVIALADTCGMHIPERSLGEKLMWAHGPREMTRNILDLLLPPDDGMPLAEVRRAYLRRVHRLISGQIRFSSGLKRLS